MIARVARAITIKFNLILILNFITKAHSLATIVITLARARQLLVWFPDPILLTLTFGGYELCDGSDNDL